MACCGFEASQVVAADVIIGPYKVLEMLGEGASSRVYAAEHLENGSRVALKVLHDRHATNLTKTMRFILECELLGRLQHPNIVRLIEHSCGAGFVRYAVLELLGGETLRDRLVRDGELSLRETIDIAIQLAAALQAVHDAGLIHCDVKPDNINISPAGPLAMCPRTVKLFDFDAAHWVDSTTTRSAAIMPHGAVVGTPGYMAPEQEQGASIDYRIDIYAFGVVLYEMLTGASPFQATTLADRVRTALFAAPKPLRAYDHLRKLPRSVETLVRACLERAPDRRPDSMAAVLLCLKDIALDLQIAETTEPTSVNDRVLAA